MLRCWRGMRVSVRAINRAWTDLWLLHIFNYRMSSVYTCWWSDPVSSCFSFLMLHSHGVFRGRTCACPLPMEMRKFFSTNFNVKFLILTFEHFWKCTPEMYLRAPALPLFILGNTPLAIAYNIGVVETRSPRLQSRLKLIVAWYVIERFNQSINQYLLTLTRLWVNFLQNSLQ